MDILITGVTGFVGGYLVSALLEQSGPQLHGLVRDKSRLLSEHQGKISCVEGDLLDYAFVKQALMLVKPTMIFHLAGQASEPASWSNPWQTYQINLLMQLNLLKGIVELGLTCRFLCITSGKVYGSVPEMQMPITEVAPLLPNSPYGVSKAAQDLMAKQYFLSHKLPIISARPFNHIGPRQTAEFVTASFAQQIALVETRQVEPVIRVGNLAAKRDFTDVRDVVDAYISLMGRGEPGEAYNIGSGRAVSIQEILDILLRLSEADIQVEPDLARMRPVDYPVSYTSIQKIREATGWQPKIDLKESLDDILNYWRGQVANKRRRR